MIINFTYNNEPGCLKIKPLKFIFDKFYRQQIMRIYECIEFDIDSITILKLNIPISEEAMDETTY